MNYCLNCGKHLPISDPHFCPYCGFNLTPYIQGKANEAKDTSAPVSTPQKVETTNSKVAEATSANFDEEVRNLKENLVMSETNSPNRGADDLKAKVAKHSKYQSGNLEVNAANEQKQQIHATLPKTAPIPARRSQQENTQDTQSASKERSDAPVLNEEVPSKQEHPTVNADMTDNTVNRYDFNETNTNQRSIDDDDVVTTPDPDLPPQENQDDKDDEQEQPETIIVNPDVDYDDTKSDDEEDYDEHEKQPTPPSNDTNHNDVEAASNILNTLMNDAQQGDSSSTDNIDKNSQNVESEPTLEQKNNHFSSEANSNEEQQDLEVELPNLNTDKESNQFNNNLDLDDNYAAEDQHEIEKIDDASTLNESVTDTDNENEAMRSSDDIASMKDLEVDDPEPMQLPDEYAPKSSKTSPDQVTTMVPEDEVKDSLYQEPQEQPKHKKPVVHRPFEKKESEKQTVQSNKKPKNNLSALNFGFQTKKKLHH